MAFIFYGALPPSTQSVSGYVNVAVPGDIFISRLGNNDQRRWNGTTWTVMTPGETRGDILPRFGAQNEVLTRGADNDPFAAEWGDPGASLVYEEGFSNLQTWTVDHQLRFRFVSVTCIKDDGVTELVPEKEYFNILTVILRFQEPVSGTAIIRR